MTDNDKPNKALFWSGVALLGSLFLTVGIVAFLVAPPINRLEFESQSLTRFIKTTTVMFVFWFILGLFIYILDKLWKDRLEGRSILQWLFKTYKK